MAKHKYIETPERLLEMWDEYKDSLGNDTIEQASSRGDVVSLSVKKPLLRQGFEAFVYRKYGFLVKQYLDNQDGIYTEYMGVITCIRQEWENDQITGSLTGLYKSPNLVARLNGLAEKTQNENVQKIELFKGIDLSVKEDNSAE
jgi:hypothetical protein